MKKCYLDRYGLDNGYIPKGKECPFAEGCVHKTEECPPQKEPFECAVARLRALQRSIKEDKARGRG